MQGHKRASRNDRLWIRFLLKEIKYFQYFSWYRDKAQRWVPLLNTHSLENEWMYTSSGSTICLSVNIFNMDTRWAGTCSSMAPLSQSSAVMYRITLLHHDCSSVVPISVICCRKYNRMKYYLLRTKNKRNTK